MITLFVLTLAAVALFFVLVPVVLMSLMLETNAARGSRPAPVSLRSIPSPACRVDLGTETLLAA